MPGKKIVAVLDADPEQCRELCSALGAGDYTAAALNSLESLENYIQQQPCNAVLIDLDSVALGNRAIRDLTSKYPGVYFLCLSNKRFHPHLQEAFGLYIYACLNKPVDFDELFYWLRSIYVVEGHSEQTN